MQQLAVGATAVAVTTVGILIAPAVATADPVTPQLGAPCPESVAGAMTQLPDLMTFVQCRNQRSGEYRWQTPESPYPNSDRWLTYGPQLTVHGEGQRNREIDSGPWVAYPQSPDSHCTAAQLDLAAAGERTPARVTSGEPGRPLKLQVLPLLFTVELTGHCLWQKVQ
jgi:hypothetical protein